MNWNLFWGLYLITFAIACWICFYAFGVRKLGKNKRCCAHTTGKVTGVSALSYGGMHLPLVEYTVNGRLYKVAGPKFRSYSKRIVSTPFKSIQTEYETNLMTRESLPLCLKVRIQRNSFISVQHSPLFELYPVGSFADVFYNPKKPKEAFIQRNEGISLWLFILLLSAAILLTALGIYILVGPRLVMS